MEWAQTASGDPHVSTLHKVFAVLRDAGWTSLSGQPLRETSQLAQARHPNGGQGITPQMVQDLCAKAWQLPEESKA